MRKLGVTRGSRVRREVWVLLTLTRAPPPERSGVCDDRKSASIKQRLLASIAGCCESFVNIISGTSQSQN